MEETVLDLTGLAVPSTMSAAGLPGRWPPPDHRGKAPGSAAAAQENTLADQLEDILAAAGDGIHSVLEYRYLRDVERAHGLPRSRRQVRVVIDGKTAYRDVYYEKYRLAVELDGELAHPDEERWRDNGSDNQASAPGHPDHSLRLAGVHGHPCQTALLQARILRQRGWPGMPRPCSAAARSPGSPGLRSFRPIASTRTAGFASHLVRLGESGTPSLVLCPEPGTCARG